MWLVAHLGKLIFGQTGFWLGCFWGVGLARGSEREEKWLDTRN